MSDTTGYGYNSQGAQSHQGKISNHQNDSLIYFTTTVKNIVPLDLSIGTIATTNSFWWLISVIVAMFPLQSMSPISVLQTPSMAAASQHKLNYLHHQQQNEFSAKPGNDVSLHDDYNTLAVQNIMRSMNPWCHSQNKMHNCKAQILR